MPTKQVIDETLYKRAKYFLKSSMRVKQASGFILYLIQVFDMVCICIAYENNVTDIKGLVYAKSSFIARYMQGVCSASYEELAYFATWRNDTVHEVYDLSKLKSDTINMIRTMDVFMRLFEYYNVDISKEEYLSEFNEYLLKLKGKAFSNTDVCPKCGGKTISLSTGVQCISCNWRS